MNRLLTTIQKDEVFKQAGIEHADFKFTSQVAGVFDDMVTRSVPFYEEIQRMVSEIATDHVTAGSIVYDLGCSTGSTLIEIDRVLKVDATLVGIDDSAAMLEKCRDKLEEAGLRNNFRLEIASLNEKINVQDASVVVLCLTLQFVRPLYREQLLRQIFEGMKPGGVLILVEKILAEDSVFNRQFINYYYQLKKRNHYSELEISQKREALENVLIPYKLSENIALCRSAGFQHCEQFFKWYNFAGLAAKKF